tara:strand:- start:884 stop:1402 length:519 start_codon:yes stop_codon:yes gene_type:complete
MRNLIIILTVFLSALTYSQESQEELGNYIGNELSILEYEIANIPFNYELLSTFKTGDNDTEFRGILSTIFSDSLSRFKYLENYNFNYLSVTNSTLTKNVQFNTWINTCIDANEYPVSKFTIKYVNWDNCESITIYNGYNEKVRAIYVYWDQSYDDVNFVNIRSISDTNLTSN